MVLRKHLKRCSSNKGFLRTPRKSNKLNKKNKLSKNHKNAYYLVMIPRIALCVQNWLNVFAEGNSK